MKKLTRRSFLGTTAAVAGGVSLFSLTGPSVSGNVLGANDRVRMAVAGVGSRGTDHINEFGKRENVEIVCVVDPDQTRLDRAAKTIYQKYGNKPTVWADYRKMLEDKSIDAVAVASTNLWHSLMTVWACQAGKDVYVEKPCSQNLFDGRQCAEAAKKYNRLVQHGTQRRSESTWARAAAAVRSGKYGKLIAARAFAHRPRNPLGFKPVTEPPETLDWDLWLGPAPKLDYHGNLVPYNWHWFWDTGNGEIGNNGVHYFDLCLWAMGEKHPSSVVCCGTRFVKDPKNDYKDQGQTPTIQFAYYDFNGTPLVFESCNLAGPKEKWRPREEAEFIMEEGIIRGGNIVRKDGKQEKIEVEFTEPAPGGNFGNFINALRNRESVPLNAPISKGHYSASVCHWANAAYRVAQPGTIAQAQEALGEHPVMRESFENVLTNLRNVFENGVKVEDIPFNVGTTLAIDGEKEKFVDCPEADLFLTRKPREPFVVPKEV